LQGIAKIEIQTILSNEVEKMIVLKRVLTVCLFISICLLSISCVIVPIDPDGGGRGNVISAGERAVDLDEYLAEYLDSIILPEIEERKVSLSTILTAASEGWDNAGELYGVRKGEIGSIYNFIVQDEVRVVAVDTESRAGFILVEYDGMPTNFTIKIAIGPVLRGTALRDSVRFIDFNQFVNQMDFAGLANELNRIGNENVMRNVDIDTLVGKTVEFTGSFGEPESNEIMIMPIFMEVK